MFIGFVRIVIDQGYKLVHYVTNFKRTLPLHVTNPSGMNGGREICPVPSLIIPTSVVEIF